MEQINWQDLLEQADKAGTPPQAGVPLTCRCEASKWKSASTGKVGFNLRWKVIAGPDEGKTFFDNLWVSEDNPTAMLMTFNKMRAIGVDPASLPQVPVEQQPNLFVGRMANIIVSTDREWGNAKQIDVDSYAPAGGVVGAPAPPPVAVAPPPVAAPPVAAPAYAAPPAAPAPAPIPQPVAAPVAAAPVAAPPAPEAFAPVAQPAVAPAPVPPAIVTPAPVAPAAPPAVAPVAPVAAPPAPAVAEPAVVAPPAAPPAPAAPASVAGAVPAPPEVFG